MADDYTTAVTKARHLRDANTYRNLQFLDQTGYSMVPIDSLPSGALLISVGYYGPDGFTQHVEMMGVKP
jgi:hypothetical protein